MSYSKLLDKIVGLQYPIFMIAVFLVAYRFGQQSAIITKIFNWYWLFYSIYVIRNSKINNSLKMWMTILIGYMLFTFIGYSYNGVPFGGYYREFKGLICPMLLVFVGAVNTDRKVYYWFLIAVGFCMLVGLYLYIFQPSWYLSFKANALSNAWYVETDVTEDNIMYFSYRFSSFFTNIYPVSYFGVFAYCIIINDLYKDRKLRLVKNRQFQILLLIIIVVGVMYTMVRVAFLYILFLTLVYFINGIKTKNSSNFVVLNMVLFVIGVLVVMSILLGEYSEGSDILEKTITRLNNVSYDMLMSDSRMNQNSVALSAWQNYITGDGIGARGGYARALGLPGITDGGWTKFLIEYGIVGLLLFLSFIGDTFKRGFKSLRYNMIELSVFSYGLISMIGADTLSKGWMITIMWICVGRIWNSHYLDIKIKTKDCI